VRACSLAAQVARLVLERSSVGQGHGVMLHQDPTAPYGRLVFSALGMGPTYFNGRVVSATDKEGAALIAFTWSVPSTIEHEHQLERGILSDSPHRKWI
jgi:hypothetical protein